MFSFSKFSIILFASIACSLILFSALFLFVFASLSCLFNASSFDKNWFFSLVKFSILSMKFCFSRVNAFICRSLLFWEFLSSVIVLDIFFISSFNLLLSSFNSFSEFISEFVIFLDLMAVLIAEALVPFLMWNILQSLCWFFNLDNIFSRAVVFLVVLSL